MADRSGGAQDGKVNRLTRRQLLTPMRVSYGNALMQARGYGGRKRQKRSQ